MFDFVTSGEITNSLKENFKKRLTTPIYGVFLVSWLIFHWEFVYAIFFVSEDKIWEATGLLKNDYLRDRYFNFSDWGNVFIFLFFWIAPFVLTYFVIWKFPKWVGIPAFEKEEEYNIAKRRIKLQKEKKLEELEVKKLEVVEEKVEKERGIKQRDPSQIWEQEYIEFRKSDFFAKFEIIIDIAYSSNPYVRSVPRDILAYSDSIGLIDIEGGTIALTDKGKYFVKQYSLHNKQEDLQN